MRLHSEQALSFDDVCLVPQYSEIESRSDPKTEIFVGGFHLTAPIISANMDTISGADMCIAMRKAGGVGALHRFMSIEDNVQEYKKVIAQFCEFDACFVTVGVKDYADRAAALYEAGARNFIVDIAHGHSLLMRRAIEFLRKTYDCRINIMAGNVATADAVTDLVKWGADIIKVGVGGGSICKTRMVTGHGVPMFSALLECSQRAMLEELAPTRHPLIVADGGIRSSGDIVKAYVAGADAVMLGSLLAGTTETPAESMELPLNNDFGDSVPMKRYRGMASAEAQEDRQWGSNELKAAPEGVSTWVQCKGPVGNVVHELTMGLKSGMSYCNAATLFQIPVKARWRIQTHAGYIEGTPHIERALGTMRLP